MDKLIFISNDDGYDAEGIRQLAEMVRPYGDVFIVAPDGGRSGASMSISSHTPVQNTFIKYEEGTDTMGSLTVWACTGTPNDCTKMAFEKLLPRRPDMVLGGINHGDNCAVNAHYSGTMSIALEGCIKHVPSIAFSSGKTATDADFSYMTTYVQQIVKMVLDEGLPLEVCLNVNIPDVESLKGMKICKMGMGDWYEEWQERDHPRGGKYYWIAGYYAPHDENDEDSDTWAFQHGYVAVTPLQLDMTAYETRERLREKLKVKN
ncbi:MAG: 5'/3'-nucleotidase SurE [Bacteroidaceae bacterium]|nr:5'/3'-nucleotidase SurE [Bacteroidaceae bacterium]